jgi:hypothetical protein
MKKILLTILILTFSLYLKAQDVQLIVPKLSIENSIKTLLDARAASFSSYTPGFGVDMYNVKLIYGGSHPLVVTLIPPNRFRIQCGIIGRANLNYDIFSFEINGEGNITIEGVMSVEGSQGQLTLHGSADAVIDVSGVPGFVMNIINANQFTVMLPDFELASFVFTLPTIPVNYFTTNYPTISLTNDNIILGLQTPSNFLIVDQKDQNGNRILNSSIAHWESNTFVSYTVPAIFSNLPVNSWQTFRGDQEYQLTPFQKYNNWNNLSEVANHKKFYLDGSLSRLNSNFKLTSSGIKIQNNLEETGIDGGQVEFADPWFIDYPDPQFPKPTGGYYERNRGMKQTPPDALVFYERDSPLDFSLSEYADYKGIFLNQPTISGKPYYKVGMLQEQTITVNGQQRKFFPYKWTGSGVSFQNEYARQTGVVFNSSDAIATAVLKGQLMSNDQNGVKNPSQRKMVRTDNGRYHVVYESMGTVWYAHSATSDFYGAWYPEQQLHYHGKNPSIAFSGNMVKVVFEEYDPQVGGDGKIWLYTLVLEQGGTTYWVSDTEFITYPNSYYGNAKPVISFTTYEIFVAYRTGTAGGIKQKTKWYDTFYQTWNWGTENDIPGTGAYSINPSVTILPAQYANPAYIYIAYEELETIYFREAFRIGTVWNYISENPTPLSTGSGFNVNMYPVISLANDPFNGYLMVSWLGIYDASGDGPMPKETGEDPLYRRAAVVKTRTATNWGTISSFSDNVDYSTNGSLNTTFGSIITWSESDGEYSKWVRRRTPFGYDAIQALSTNGIHTLVSNGSEFANIKAMVFNKSTNVPYFLNRCTNDFTYIPDGFEKLTASGTIDISYGRSGIIEKNGIEFVFNIGDVLLNSETIKFIERADTLPVTSLEELNSWVRTDTLNLNSQSELIFSDYYYVVFADKADSLLSSEFNVNFKCELVKLSTGEVVGVFEQVNYNKTNLDEFGHQGYLVDCSGIETGDYYLRLTASVNEEVGLSLSDIQMDNVLLEKSKLNVRNFKGETLPIEYALEQNYPNPFNPTTTIRYQLPKDGMVTLKVYDILGAEVVTLVNEEKAAGKYEANFDASRLASGVYIYRIQVNEFNSVKKMVLLK